MRAAMAVAETKLIDRLPKVRGRLTEGSLLSAVTWFRVVLWALANRSAPSWSNVSGGPLSAKSAASIPPSRRQPSATARSGDSGTISLPTRSLSQPRSVMMVD